MFVFFSRSESRKSPGEDSIGKEKALEATRRLWQQGEDFEGPEKTQEAKERLRSEW